MKRLLVFAFVLLAGCAHQVVPVTMTFPDSPGSKAMEPCPELEKVSDGAKFSDISTTVNNNYTTYYECSLKVDIWIEWYNTQKNIFDGINK